MNTDNAFTDARKFPEMGLATRVVATLALLAIASNAHSGVTVDARTNAISAPPLRVLVDPRIELFSLLFRLAGNPEYNQGKVESYIADVETQFGRQRGHRVIALARQLRATRGVAYDACMSMAVHVTNAYELGLIAPLDPWPDGLDRRWTPESTTNFLALARQFVADAGFRTFVEHHETLYRTTESRLREFMDREAHLEWYHAYFGERPQASFTVVPGMLNGGSCYGPHCRDGSGGEQLFCILGVWKTDANGLPVFTSEMVETVVHEFCHSYANAIVDRHESELLPAGGKLFQFTAGQMRSQAYGTAQTMLRESLVRACTVRYIHRYKGEAAARRAVQEEIGRGFAWTEELSALLAEYEAQRDRYPTLESFSPRLVSFFDQYAGKFEKDQTALAAKRPRIISMVPANGEEDVDPELSEIRVTFDRPMQDGSWSLVGGGPHFPELSGRPHYDSERRTWTVSVRLKPEWEYEFYVNRGQFNSFRSNEGVPLDSVRVVFKTGKAQEPD
jgi:hypothetical protein